MNVESFVFLQVFIFSFFLYFMFVNLTLWKKYPSIINEFYNPATKIMDASAGKNKALLSFRQRMSFV